MKFRAHDTFAIRKGWLHKGMRHIMDNPQVFVDKKVNAMDQLGIGTNMVKALRYWLQATGLTKEVNGVNRGQYPTDFGARVWQYDCYLEEDGTLFLLHYQLASNHNLATSWYYFFNEYKMNEISKESFLEGISAYILEEAKHAVASRTLQDDFDCIIKTYLPSDTTSTPESNLDCPLSELQLVSVLDKKEKTFSKKAPRLTAINLFVILSVIVNERDKQKDTTDEIKISTLEKAPCNIGKVFNLDNLAVAMYLDRLQSMGHLRVIRTAGLDYIKVDEELDFNHCLDLYYQSINN